MSSTTKTLELLKFFSPARPEIGLSQICRLAHRDKATTYRHLQALEDAGFIEQNPVNKCYRLGPTLLQLAQIREATVPRKAAVERPLSALAYATGETCHITVLSGSTVYELLSCESPHHGTRAIIDIQTFPLHATSTGQCALAFGPADLMDVAYANLQTFTENTAASPEALNNAVQTIRETGFGRADRSYEDEVQGLSAPLYDQTSTFAGAVSVASVATRFTPTLERIIKENLMIAARDISRNWGGEIPSDIEAKWAIPLYPHKNWTPHHERFKLPQRE